MERLEGKWPGECQRRENTSPVWESQSAPLPRENWHWGGWACVHWPSCFLQDLFGCLVSKCREIRAWKRSTSQTIWHPIRSGVKRSRLIICSEDCYKRPQPLIWWRKSLLFRHVLQCNEKTGSLEGLWRPPHPFIYHTVYQQQNPTQPRIQTSWREAKGRVLEQLRTPAC